jgi:hypothetical protein
MRELIKIVDEYDRGGLSSKTVADYLASVEGTSSIRTKPENETLPLYHQARTALTQRHSSRRFFQTSSISYSSASTKASLPESMQTNSTPESLKATRRNEIHVCGNREMPEPCVSSCSNPVYPEREGHISPHL